MSRTLFHHKRQSILGGLVALAVAATCAASFAVPASATVHASGGTPTSTAQKSGTANPGAGPASITTLIVLSQNQAVGLWVSLVALAVNLVLVVLALHYSEWW